MSNVVNAGGSNGPLAVGEVYGTFAEVVTANAGTSSAGSAPVLTPTFASATAAQLADTSRDYMVYLLVGTAGTVFSLSIGPTSTPANAVVSSITPVANTVFTVRLPAGWYLKWAGTSTTMASQIAIGC
jgi:hypothetical protein